MKTESNQKMILSFFFMWPCLAKESNRNGK